MSNKHKQYNPQFKARIALEAVRGEKTVPQLSSQYSIHPSLINNWKRQLLEGASGIFESGGKQTQAQQDHQAQVDELYRQIGQLKVERDFLASRSAQLGLGVDKPW